MDRNEAIKIVKSNHPTDKQMLNDALEFLIPELKESEDERISEQIIDYFVAKKVNEPQPVLDSWIAWLEKQSAPNPYSGTSFDYNGHIWGMCARDGGVDILRDKQLIRHLEKQGEQILDNSAKTCKDEQMTAWSEEDEDTIKFLISHFCTYHPTRTFQFTINEVVTHDELLRKIRHLKHQTTWKPSEEQMEVLGFISLTGVVSSSEQGQKLIDLYNDLKKLKGE